MFKQRYFDLLNNCSNLTTITHLSYTCVAATTAACSCSNVINQQTCVDFTQNFSLKTTISGQFRQPDLKFQIAEVSQMLHKVERLQQILFIVMDVCAAWPLKKCNDGDTYLIAVMHFSN